MWLAVILDNLVEGSSVFGLFNVLAYVAVVVVAFLLLWDLALYHKGSRVPQLHS